MTALIRRSVGALLLDTLILIAVGLALPFGAGCGGTMRPLTPEELQTLELKVWRHGMLEPRQTQRHDRPPPVRWRHDLGCDGSPYHWRGTDGACVVGEYSPTSDTIDVSATNPMALPHEYAHAILARYHQGVPMHGHHWEAADGAYHEHPTFARVRSAGEDYMRKEMDAMGVGGGL